MNATTKIRCNGVRPVRRVRLFVAATTLAGALGALGCDRFGAPPGDGEGGSGGDESGSTATTSTSSAADGTTAGTSMLAESCTPSEGASVGDDCGVFVVEQGAGDGTKANAFGSITEALATDAARIFVCTGTWDEPIRVDRPVEIYGGVDCASGWIWRLDDGARSTFRGPVDEPAFVSTEGANPLLVRGLSIVARDAIAERTSSIAAQVEGGDVTFESSDLTAGRGANGAAGAASVGQGTTGPDGIDGIACLVSGETPGAQGVSNPSCAVGSGSGDGGPGGLFGEDPSGGGEWGNGALGGQPGRGARFDPLSGNELSCLAGGAGETGMAGSVGGPGLALGSFFGRAFRGGTGGRGGNGGAGGGGGGGGGGKNQSGAVCSGPSGGSGGAGGCGGLGGAGGGPAGASFGVVSFEAAVKLVRTRVTTSPGGTGGTGAIGQPGGAGGDGGSGGGGGGFPLGCAGGSGGMGGKGGDGGGGSGGHSIGIAYVGTQPVLEDATIEPGPAGDGGLGGTQGEAGTSGQLREF